MEFANAVRTVYSTGIEYISESFAPLTGAKLDAYVLLNGPTAEPIFEVVAMEPTTISRRGSRQIAIEFMIVTGRHRTLLIGATQMIHAATRNMPGENIEFTDRLEWYRPSLPAIMTGEVRD